MEYESLVFLLKGEKESVWVLMGSLGSFGLFRFVGRQGVVWEGIWERGALFSWGSVEETLAPKPLDVPHPRGKEKDR